MIGDPARKGSLLARLLDERAACAVNPCVAAKLRMEAHTLRTRIYERATLN